MKKNEKQSLNELELEQHKLNNLSMAANMKSVEFRMACDKIEHARRNVEVISRTWITLLEKNMEESEVSKKIKDILLLNLDILKDTKQL